MYVYVIICVQLKQNIVIKQVENSIFNFSYLSSIVDVEDSESSLKIVRSHDPLSKNTQVSKTVCEHNGIPMKSTQTCIQTS